MLDWYWDLHLVVKFFVLYALALTIMLVFGAIVDLTTSRKD